MPRTTFLLAFLGVLALLLCGAWWLARPTADVGGDVPQFVALPDDSDVDTVPTLDLADADSIVAVEPEATRHEAIAEFEPVESSAADDALAGSLRARGRVVDAATGETLPGYALELKDARGKIARSTTDAVGVFALEKALTPGPLMIRAPERGPGFDLAAELAIDPSTSEVRPIELRVVSGPTYRVVIEPTRAPPLAEHDVSLVLNNGKVRVRGTVGTGEPAWVRFAPMPDDAARKDRARLTLNSRDGVWVGAALVRVGVGRQAEVVILSVSPESALEVRVVDGDGQALANAFVSWTIPSGINSRDSVTRSDGRAVFERVGSDSGTLQVRLVRWRDHESTFALVRGERRVETVTMQRAPSAGSIGGTIVSDSGTYERDVRMRLVPLDAGRGVRSLETNVRWTTRSSARVGLFDFDDLPLGRFRLDVRENDFYAWEPRRTEVEAPREGLVFTVKDTVLIADLAFEPREEDGSPYSGRFEVRLDATNESRVRNGRDGSLVVTEFPIDKPLRWRLDAPGRAAEFGTWSDLAPLASVGGRERRGAAPVLACGWAQMFRVVHQNNAKAIAGATAVVDGREVGVTGADGRVVLRAESAPTVVQFRFKDWKTSWTADVVPEKSSTSYEATVRLLPPKNARKK